MIQQNKNNLKILSCISGVDFLVNNYRLRLVFDNVSLGVEKYFFIAVLFAFSLSSNVIDLIPYSFTVTSHLIVIFALFFSTFIGKQHYYKRIFLYNNVGDGIVCNSSSDSKSPNGGLDSFNETKFEEMSLKKLRITLENMSAVSLKKLAKYYGIKLRGHRRKAEKISLIMDYFSKRKTASLEDNFEVLANENAKQKGFMISNSFINQREDNFMNISAIFRLDKKKRYSKWRNTQTTKDFLAELTDILGLSSESELFSTIKRGRGDIYAHPFVAIDVAAYVSPRSKVLMYNYVFYSLDQKYLTDEQIVKTEKYKTLLLEHTQTKKRHGALLLKRSWHKLKQGFCYYVIKVNRTTDIYKMGVCKNINETLRTYRRMDATFQIIFLMYFNTEKDMKDFDSLQNRVFESSKLILSKEQIINLTIEEILAEIHKMIEFANFSDKVTIESPDSLDEYNQMVPSIE